jgi:DNA-binding beta-propeller fold protein YncE
MRPSRSRLCRYAGVGLLAVPGLLLAGWWPAAAAQAARIDLAARTGVVRINDGLTSENAAGHRISLVDHEATISVGRLPSSVAIDQRTGLVWVVNSLDNTVSELSEAKRVVVATLKVGVSPVDVAVDPKSGTVWVSCLGPYGQSSADNTVDEISEGSGKVVARIKVGSAPFGIAIDPRTGTVWVADTNAHAVSEISEATRRVIATIRTGPGSAPDSVTVNPVSGVVWVAKLGDTVAEIAASSGKVIATIKVRPAAEHNALNSIAVDSRTGIPWVASDFYTGSSYTSYASALDPVEHRVAASVLVPKKGWYANTADGIAVDPATRTVWVAENGANTVTLLSEGQASVARNLPTGAEPVAVAVDSRAKTVWVVNNYADSVTEYAYSYPRFAARPPLVVRAGKRISVGVHATGFPIPEVTVTGGLPAGLRVRLVSGGLYLRGDLAAATSGHTYRVTISADNGIATVKGQYAVTEQLVIRVR